MPQVPLLSTSEEVTPVVNLILTHLFHTPAFSKLADSLSLHAQGTCCLGRIECLKPEPFVVQNIAVLMAMPQADMLTPY